MTRKHYKAFATLLSGMRAKLPHGDPRGEALIDAFEAVCVEEFAKENPSFSPAKFREAAR